MFKRCVIHYPPDEAGRKYISKELASFRAAETVKYIQSLNLTERETEALFDELEKAIAAQPERSA